MPYRRRKRKKNAKEPKVTPVETLPALSLIPADLVDEVWPLCAALIEAGCANGETTADEMRIDAIGGRADLWMAWSGKCEAAAITRMLQTHNGKVCLIDSFAAESWKRVKSLLPELENWARNAGAIATRTHGRKGWERMLPEYKLRWVILDREL